MSLKSMCLVLALTIFNVIGYSQNNTISQRVYGVTVEKVKKRSYSPLALSRVYVLSAKNEVVAQATSIDDGSFNIIIPQGQYNILIESIGHKSIRMGLNVKDNAIDLGTIVLEIGEELNASTISANTLIHRDGTRISYDVSSDPDRYKINMTAMISRIPNLRMSQKNGNLVFNNQEFDRILIDDENNGLINKLRQYPMEFIKAHYMKNIEVVLPNDPEYQNSNPILLIRLAKKLPLGAAAEQSFTATTNNEYSANTDVVTNTPIMGVGLRYTYSFERRPTLTDEIYTDYLEGDTRNTESILSDWSRGNTHSISTNLFKNYLKETLRFNATLNTSYSDATSFSEARTRYYDWDNTLLRDETTLQSGRNRAPFRINGSFRIKGTINSKNRKEFRKKHQWLIEYSYSDKENQSDFDYSNYHQTGLLNEKEHRINSSIELKRIRFKQLIFNTTLEGGYYSRDYNNITNYGDDPQYSAWNNGMNYNQSVLYANLRCVGFAFKKITFAASLKTDYLNNSGYYLNGTTKSPLDYSSFNFCPRISASYKYRRQTFDILYSITETRPNINKLNPFEDRSNPSFIRTGNPNLKEQLTKTTSVSYRPGFSFDWLSIFFSGEYSTTENLIGSIVQPYGEGTMVQTYCNYGRARTYKGISGASIFLNKKTTIGLDLSYNQSHTYLPSGITNITKTINSNAFLYWQPNGFEAYACLTLRPRVLSAQTSKVFMDPTLTLSVSRYFEKPRFGCSIEAFDVLRSNGKRETVIKDATFKQRSLRESLGRSLQIRVYWRFGQFKNTETVDVGAYDM